MVVWHRDLVIKMETSVLDIYESINKQIPMPERPEKRGMSTSDYLRIASAGLNILGAPSEGSGIWWGIKISSTFII